MEGASGSQLLDPIQGEFRTVHEEEIEGKKIVRLIAKLREPDEVVIFIQSAKTMIVEIIRFDKRSAGNNAPPIRSKEVPLNTAFSVDIIRLSSHRFIVKESDQAKIFQVSSNRIFITKQINRVPGQIIFLDANRFLSFNPGLNMLLFNVNNGKLLKVIHDQNIAHLIQKPYDEKYSTTVLARTNNNHFVEFNVTTQEARVICKDHPRLGAKSYKQKHLVFKNKFLASITQSLSETAVKITPINRSRRELNQQQLHSCSQTIVNSQGVLLCEFFEERSKIQFITVMTQNLQCEVECRFIKISNLSDGMLGLSSSRMYTFSEYSNPYLSCCISLHGSSELYMYIAFENAGDNTPPHQALLLNKLFPSDNS